MPEGKILSIALFIFAVLGVLDAGYLTVEHFSEASSVACSFGIFSECGKVLGSKYSEILGIPLALIGLIHYLLLSFAALYYLITKKENSKYLILILATIGLFASFYLIYLQFFILGALCLYCILSALNSVILFTISNILFEKERVVMASFIFRYVYVYLIRPILFLASADFVHEATVSTGEFAGKSKALKSVNKFFFNFEDEVLSQKIEGIKFSNPVGLAAGFDYDARLTQLIPSLGFGYEVVGTITNMPYDGNPKPMLGRLPRSRSLMVNKGFKSRGVKKIVKNLEDYNFDLPLWISVGRTNSRKLKTQKESVSDIIEAFKEIESSKVKHSFYELNISCPNLYGKITFYPLDNLEELLTEIDKLRIKKPIFIKMPIEKSDKDMLSMLKVISKHSPKGVVFGNLQKDRKNKEFVKEELKMWKIGYFSGKPTHSRSNELIKLTYSHFKDRFIIIGCGGVFDGKQAYEKITLGASLVQLITSLVYEGPQRVSQINADLVKLLKKDGFVNISEAVGSKIE